MTGTFGGSSDISGPMGPSDFGKDNTPDYGEIIWSDRGYMNVTEGHTLNFQISEVPRSMKYQFYLRYQPKVRYYR